VDGPGRQERLQVAGQIARGAVVRRDDQHRSGAGAIVGSDQGGEQVGPQGGRDVRVDSAV
jgi:hypothetical protein